MVPIICFSARASGVLYALLPGGATVASIRARFGLASSCWDSTSIVESGEAGGDSAASTGGGGSIEGC